MNRDSERTASEPPSHEVHGGNLSTEAAKSKLLPHVTSHESSPPPPPPECCCSGSVCSSLLSSHPPSRKNSYTCCGRRIPNSKSLCSASLRACVFLSASYLCVLPDMRCLVGAWSSCRVLHDRIGMGWAVGWVGPGAIGVLEWRDPERAVEGAPSEASGDLEGTIRSALLCVLCAARPLASLLLFVVVWSEHGLLCGCAVSIRVLRWLAVVYLFVCAEGGERVDGQIVLKGGRWKVEDTCGDPPRHTSHSVCTPDRGKGQSCCATIRAHSGGTDAC